MRWATLGLSVLLAAMIGVALLRQEVSIREQRESKPLPLDEIVRAIRNDRVNITTEVKVMADQTTMETTWKSAKGNHKVTTPRVDGENETDWAARHEREVDAQQAKFPPVP